jgi:hypothetical protein
MWPFGLKYPGLAAFNALTVHHKHGDQINAIAVRSFWGGAADSVGGVDPKLVGLGVPGFLALEVSAHAA